MPIDKKAEKKSESKIETRFYDELFKRLQDGESDEFSDPESVGMKLAHVFFCQM